jgi:hypothetical protein
MNTKDILERALRNQHFRKALMQGSFNREHYAKQRLDEFRRMLANTAKLEKVRAFFSTPNLGAVGYPSGGASGFQNFGTVIQLASLTALVSSIAGLVALEKSVDMPNLTIYLPDLVSVTGAPPVYPVAGAYQYSDTGISQQVLQVDATPNQPAPSVNATPFDNVNIPGLPRSYKLTITAIDSAGNKATYTILDSGDGRFLAPAPSVTVNGITIDFPSNLTINYGSGNLLYGGVSNTDFRVSSSNNLTSVVFTLTFEADFPGQNAYPVPPNDTRLRLSMREFTVNTKPNKIEAEIDLFLVHGLQKSMNTDIVSLLTERLSNTLTDLINRYIAQVYVTQILPQAGLITVDVSTPVGGGTTISTYNQYNPIVDKIMGELEGINYILAKRSFIGLTANAYLVSSRMAYWLARAGLIDPSNFVREDSRFINGLVGYYRGVPVIVNVALDPVFDRTVSVPNSQLFTAGGFAIHNLVENNLSPVLYATFLPITAGPTVGNFNNTVQQAFALFHQSDAIPFVKELVVPFRFDGLPPVTGL